MSWLRFFLILLIPLICHAWLWKRKSKSSPASSRTPRYTSSSRTPTHSWTARKPSIRRPSIRRPSRPACSTKSSCESCTSHRSWSGSCRWCPDDGGCHAAGAVFTNPCRRSENIVNKWNCYRARKTTPRPKTPKPPTTSTPKQRCKTMTTCVSCTSHKSWSGSSCRWCPKDERCHAYGAILTNPCRRSQNIVNKWNCNRAPKTTPRPTTPKPPTTSAPKQRCKTMTTCVSCTSHKSWSGSSCRWCPKDERCHAYGAILTNPCRRSQNIVNKWNCNRAPKTTPRPTTPKQPTISAPKQRCKTMTTCVSCTSHKSWSGSSCRWCPKDEKCHAYGAILTNPCRRSQNIVNRESCSNSSSGTLTPKTSKPSTSRKPCITKTNCTSCTSHKSWSGSSCSWCPKDGKCHAHGAIWTNPCRTFQNIVNKDSCSLKLPSRRPPRTRCITKTNCTSCTSHKSWSGRPCRWCPKDGKCHAHGAIWTNPCTQSQNIVKKESCPTLTSVELCINKTNCASCTSHKSSSGFPCRWCLKDGKCHAHDAISTNLCKGSENIVNKERCFPPPCRIMTNCSSCTSHQSSSGRPCRWCPEDNKCHAYTAIFTNPCRIRQNIVNKERCFPPPCRIMTNCSSCTSHQSSSGRPCRWCPEDNKCHAYTAIFTNPCRIRQNIVNKERCFPPPCTIMTNCSSCTSHKSSSGRPCRWCPEDNKCHAYTAIFTNPCRIRQNIVNKERCFPPPCTIMTNCSSCTSHKSSSGRPCRWCPEDNKCHAYTAIFTNPCRIRQNIVNKERCFPPPCTIMTNCSSCTSHQSSSGRPCRWCPEDNKCHAYTAIFTNPCRIRQNIVNKERCFPPPCRIMTNCSSCTSHKSSSGRPCRWCPEDNKCHAYTAIFTNPCRIRQNIVNKERCFPPPCTIMTNCSSCTSHKSSSGRPCRWCPEDNKCHAYTAIFTNPCRIRQNIVNKERCFPPPCRIMTNCSSCTSHQSSSGRPCRWCPEDNKCHAYTAIFTNPCRIRQNIVNKERCFPPPCRIMTNCSSCTSHQSSSGRPCRWCPEDNKCHAYTAIFTNPCRIRQNIVNKERCFPPPCTIMTNCSSCTSHKSSSGRPCRWCPEDNKCHAYTAIFTNPCRIRQNIVNKERCFPPPCRIMTNCSSCTSHKSSSGRPCRWCPEDNKCHAYTAIFTNPCRIRQNIVNKERCFPPPCRIMTNCSSCTSHKSSSGRPCRWCPEDNKCHAYTAIFTNPCRIRQNIVNKERCFPPPCTIMTNCSSCTSHQSSSGRPCRWCPEDNKCHAYTAIFTNPCRIRQNIVNKERCFPPPCTIMTNCSSCTSHKSSSGRPCRWCPEDNKCHAYTAIFTNPCRIRQNIVNKERCFPPPCRIMTNCSSCTSHKSSSGRPCRWCPEDNKCHAYTAIFTNPCRIRQNIVNKERCFPPPCRIMTNCSSCTSHMSSSGFLCRWCPEDNKCYAHDATFTNSCSIFQNININGSCPFPSSYDRNLSYKMVVLSALAYADNVSNYIAKAAKVDTFRVVKQISNPCRSSKCPGLTTCFGFIAVSEKEKAIAIVFRGAQSRCQALYGHGPSVPLSVLSEYVLDKYNPVQTYFSDQFQKIWNDMKLDVYSQIDKHPSYELWVTGHCLGGALASLASTHIAVERKTPKNKLILYTFGQPRVGNYNYSLAHDMLVPISFRVVHYGDPVVHVPNCNSKVQPGTLSRCQAGLGPYHHGKEIFYNEMFNNSSYKTCDGLPRNEDVTCSNKLFAPRIEDQLNNLELYHYKYFGFDVSRYM